MMKNHKRFKNGKFVDIPVEEIEIIKNRSHNRKKDRMSTETKYDVKIKELENSLEDIKKTVAMLVEQLSKAEQ